MKFLNSAIILNLNYTPKAFLARQECESNIIGSVKRNWISLAVEIHCLATVWYTYTLLILVCWTFVYTWHAASADEVWWDVSASNCARSGPSYLSQKGVQNNAILEWKEIKNTAKPSCWLTCRIVYGYSTYSVALRPFCMVSVFGMYSNALCYKRSQKLYHESPNGSHFSRFSSLLHDHFAVINYNNMLLCNLWILYQTSFYVSRFLPHSAGYTHMQVLDFDTKIKVSVTQFAERSEQLQILQRLRISDLYSVLNIS
jgi:hypothetical protein